MTVNLYQKNKPTAPALYYRNREIAFASYEANVLVEPVESSGFDSATTGTNV